jgi:hypothetical protein
MSPLPLPPSREEILNRGEQASQLLNSPVFNLAVRSAIESWQDQSLRSEPGAVAEREALYYQIRGLQQALIELPGFINQALALTQRELEQEEGAAAAWSNYLNS